MKKLFKEYYQSMYGKLKEADVANDEGHISKYHPAHAFASINESPADDDMKEAEKLKKPLTNAIAGIGRSMDNINRMMSSFNAPGLKHAFIDAIKVGVKRQGQFDERAAYKRFKEYYDR